MKTLLMNSLGIMLLFFTATCSKLPNDQLEVKGTIQEQGFTSYQYGTHTITNEETFYALKSDSIDLNQYLNQEVSIRAVKIEGYPVDGGPVYLKVLEIK